VKAATRHTGGALLNGTTLCRPADCRFRDPLAEDTREFDSSPILPRSDLRTNRLPEKDSETTLAISGQALVVYSTRFVVRLTCQFRSPRDIL